MADKITLNTLASIQNDSTAVALINANSATIVAGIDNTLSRDGTSPNQMQAPIDMNGQPLINLPAPTTMDEPLRLADINSIISVIPTITVPGLLQFTLKGVNFNSANTDNSVVVPLPAGFTNFRVQNIVISSASASISTATAGVFRQTGGTGQVIAANQALTVTQSNINTNNNGMVLTLTNASTEFYFGGSLFFRIGTAQGSPATANVTFLINPLT